MNQSKHSILLLFSFFFMISCSDNPKNISKDNMESLSSKKETKFRVERFSEEPIIQTSTHPILEKEAEEYGYQNINGPSLIRVPDWVENPLGKYYLYFAHHKGKYIRLAYSNDLKGPWTLHDKKILPLEESGLPTRMTPELKEEEYLNYAKPIEIKALMEVLNAAKIDFEKRIAQGMKSSSPLSPHLASPEVFIDQESRQIRLYFHGIVVGRVQMSRVAISNNGIDFKALNENIGMPYMRIFEYRDSIYALSMPGLLYRSKNGLNNFQVRNKWLFDTNVRHSGILLEGETLYVFYSRVGDDPEHILYTKIDLSSKNWMNWETSKEHSLLLPEKDWEGGNLESQPSMRGEMTVAVKQLRDPDIFKDENGDLYLLYSGAGEQAIGIVKLHKE